MKSWHVLKTSFNACSSSNVTILSSSGNDPSRIRCSMLPHITRGNIDRSLPKTKTVFHPNFTHSRAIKSSDLENSKFDKSCNEIERNTDNASSIWSRLRLRSLDNVHLAVSFASISLEILSLRHQSSLFVG